MKLYEYLFPTTNFIDVKSTFSVVCLTLIFYVFLFHYPFSYNYMVEINFENFIFFPSLICFSVFLIIHFLTEKKISFSILDLLIFFLLIFSFGGILFKNSTLNFNNEYFICSLTTLMIYFVMRLSSSFLLHVFFPILISIFFFVELCIGLNQFLTCINSGKDLSSDITGSLQNSGVYSYFLIICLPLLFYSLKILSGSKTIKKIIFIVTLISIAIIFVTTQSRTAIVTFFVALAFLLSRKSNIKIRKFILFIRNKKLIVVLTLVGLITGILYCLIQIRPGSFEGRIFIWQTTIRHFPDYLFTGIGIGKFSYYYPQWQIEYFSSHQSPSASYFLNADETHVAFNELLQLLIETGLLGFTCCASLFVHLFKIKSDENKAFIVTLKQTLILILITSLTSYPLHCNGILFLLAFCIAGLLGNKKNFMIFEITKSGNFGILTFLVVQFFIGLVVLRSFNHYLSISKWNSLREDLLMPPSKIKKEYLQLYPFLSSNGKFLLDMGEHLSDASEFLTAIKVIEESKKYYISSRTFSSSAEAYYQSGNITASIKNLEDLSNLIPHKFYPRYKLVKLYYQTGEFLKGNEMAKNILSMPVKKMSREVSKIKKETQMMFDVTNEQLYKNKKLIDSHNF